MAREIFIYEAPDGSIDVDDMSREQAIAALKEAYRELRSLREAQLSLSRLRVVRRERTADDLLKLRY